MGEWPTGTTKSARTSVADRSNDLATWEARARTSSAYVPRSRTSLQTLYRSYFDNWKVGAINPELRIYQELSPSFQARFRYRYYKQTSAFFYESDPNQYTFEDQYVTADPKLSAFHINELGIQFLVLGAFLEGRAHRSIAGAQVDLSFNYR